MGYNKHQSAIIEGNPKIGNGTFIWHYTHIMPDCQIGDNCILGQNVFIDNGVIIGNGVKIQNNVSLYNGLLCEDNVFIGPSAVFTNVLNPRSFIDRKSSFQKTVIRRGATIGANATIICGIEIGSFSMIGAGAVIVKNVKPYALMVGNPGVQIGWVSEAGHTLHFENSTSVAICPETNETYKLKNDLEVHKQ